MVTLRVQKVWWLQEGIRASPALQIGRTHRSQEERREIPGGMEQQRQTHTTGLMDEEWTSLARIKQCFSTGAPLASDWDNCSLCGTVGVPFEGNLHAWTLPTKCQSPPPWWQPWCFHCISKHPLGHPLLRTTRINKSWQPGWDLGSDWGRPWKPKEKIWPWSLRQWEITEGLQAKSM